MTLCKIKRLNQKLASVKLMIKLEERKQCNDFRRLRGISRFKLFDVKNDKHTRTKHMYIETKRNFG